jgi:hypothetical protein
MPRFIPFREWLMKPNHVLLLFTSLVVLAALLLPSSATAQQSAEPTEGINSGNYNIKQTVEFGYRFVRDEDFKDPRGNRSVYNTFVNLDKGVRLFEHTLEMRSLNHQGWLFDNFYVSSFGYGGDPNDVTRLRAYKNKWYNFSTMFRRDKNFWDYNLLANPLNPAVPVANSPSNFFPSTSGLPVTIFSPHQMNIVRRMNDYNLTLLPQSRVRFRLGYNRNISEGPSFSSFHEGTDVLLFQDWKTTVNSYQFGVDFKWLPRTNISYDQFLHYYKGDTSWVDNNQTFQLANGTPVDLGLPFNTGAGQPCAKPFLDPPAPRGTVNPSCNGYLLYQRAARVRIPFPTEQLSFQSNYFKNFDFSGRFVYSSSDGDVPVFNENFGFDQNRTGGLVTRTRQRQFSISGPAKPKRFSVSTDFGMTWQVTSKFRILDMFRFANFRIPGQWVFGESSLFSGPLVAGLPSMLVPPNIFVPGPIPPANCNVTKLPPVTTGCPQHNNSSPADIISGTSSVFLGQNLKNNLFELDYDFNKHIGARLGYRFRHRLITHRDATDEDLLFFPTLPNRGACAGVPLNPDGSCTTTTSDSGEDQTEINEHSALFGIWTRPTDALRLSFDMELMSADNTLTRISPRQLQHYKVRATYKPVSWASFGASVNILENRDNVSEIFNKQHNRIYGFSAMFEPNERFAFDIGYDYNDIFSTTNICYSLGFGPLPRGSTPCPSGEVPAPISAISLYTNKSHFGYFNLMWKPIKRLTTHVGYAITSTAGSTLILNPNAPVGPLAYNYHKPYAGFALELYRGLFWKVNWAYYGYNEKEQLLQPDSTGPRDFRGNMVTVAVRYAF